MQDKTLWRLADFDEQKVSEYMLLRRALGSTMKRILGITDLRKLLSTLDPAISRKIFFGMGLIAVLGAVAAFAELLGVVALVSVILLVSDPLNDQAFDGRVIRILQLLGFQEDVLLVAVGLVAVISVLFRFLVLSSESWFAEYVRTILVTYCVRLIACAPFRLVRNEDESRLSKIVITEVNEVCDNYIWAMVTLVSSVLTVVILGGALLWAETTLALYSFGLVVSVLGIARFTSKSLVRTLGMDREKYVQQQFGGLRGLLEGIRQVKVYNLEQEVVKKFGGYSRRLANIRFLLRLVESSPRYALEIALLAVLLGYLFLQPGDVKNSGALLSSLSLFVLASLRIMPAAQKIYQSFSQMLFATPAVKSLSKFFLNFSNAIAVEIETDKRWVLGRLEHHSDSAVKMRDAIWQAAGRRLLSVPELQIPVGAFVAIVGPSGSGKTVFVDAIAGLVAPSGGYVEVRVAAPERATKITYVPQFPYVHHLSVREFMTQLGSTHSSNGALVGAMQSTGLVDSERHGYEMLDQDVGGSSLQFSGGELQRLNLARALLERSSLQVYDESTSALDQFAERQILLHLSQQKDQSSTVLWVTHRYHAVTPYVDWVVVIESGAVTFSGPPGQAKTDSKYVRNMLEVR